MKSSWRRALASLGLALALAAGAHAQTTLRIGLAEDPDVLDPTLARSFVGRIVFSALCGVDRTLGRLTDAGLDASVVSRSVEPFGPVMTARAQLLEARGVVDPGQRHEELVVVRGRAPR